MWLDLIKMLAETKGRDRINYQLEIGYEHLYVANSKLPNDMCIKEIAKSFKSLQSMLSMLFYSF